MDLNELEVLAQAATPGPWVCGIADANAMTMNLSGGHCAVASHMGSTTHHAITGPSNDSQSMMDAAFIAAANPAVVLELIAEIRKLKGNI